MSNSAPTLGAMHFFIGRQGQRLGPFDEQQVRDQLAAGAIGLDDLAWREGLADWQPVRVFFAPAPGTFTTPPPLPATPPPLPPPSFSAPVAAIAPSAPAVLRLARREIRLGAVVLDLVVSLALAGPGLWWLMRVYASLGLDLNQEALLTGRISITEIQLAVMHLSLPLLAVLVPSLVLLVIQTWLLTVRGQTLGKKWLRIRIVRTDGHVASFMQVFVLRSMVLQIIALIPVVGIPVFVAENLLIFRKDRRCLHDLMAGTTVIEE